MKMSKEKKSHASDCKLTSSAESPEGRGKTEGNSLQSNRPRIQSRTRLQQALERVREVAVGDRNAQFTSIWHLVYDIDRLREAFYSIKPRSAAGIDGVTKKEYESRLDENLADLSSRLRRGAYHAQPVRRVYIPKSDGRQRPLGIPALEAQSGGCTLVLDEDKIVQCATAEVLGVIYETDFQNFSYGFRPGRSQHLALDTLATGLMRRRLNVVLDADIRGFFDNIDHEWLLKFVRHRITDKRVLRHIEKWLLAGVFEEEAVHVAEYGTPQGGSISPLLANIYLHYAFDKWARQWQGKVATGEMLIVRYADDVVICFEYREEAERFLAGMQERLNRFHLELNMEKTHLLNFGRKALEAQEVRGEAAPPTFDFLGFTHYCSRTLNQGRFVVKRQTARKKMRLKLQALRKELHERLNEPVPVVGKWLGKVLTGHYQYYAVPFNYPMLSAFRQLVVGAWKRALARRSQKATCTWERANQLRARYLPAPRILHPYPDRRPGVTT